MVKVDIKQDESQVESVPVEVNSFWDDDEARLLRDIQKIERSNMNFAERKYYTQLCEIIYTLTEYYKHYESVADLLWAKKGENKVNL